MSVFNKIITMVVQNSLSYADKYKMKFTSIIPNVPKPQLYRNKCFFGVSINNNFYSGNKILVFLKWIEKRFPSCMILLGGGLHRYNEMVFKGVSEEEGRILSIAIQDKIKRCLDEALLNVNDRNIFSFKVWEDYSVLNEVKSNKDKLFQLFYMNKEFRNEILMSSQGFLDRKISQKVEIPISYDEALHWCTHYVLEEVAVFDYLYKSGLRVQVYSGQHLPVVKSVAAGKYADLGLNLNNGVCVDLRVCKK